MTQGLHQARLISGLARSIRDKEIYFEDFQRELRAIFRTEGIEDNWARIQILLRNLTGVALVNAMIMVDPPLTSGGSVITDADELLSFLRATFLDPLPDMIRRPWCSGPSCGRGLVPFWSSRTSSNCF